MDDLVLQRFHNIRDFLLSMGFPEEEIRQAAESGCADVNAAVTFLTDDNAPSSREAQPPTPPQPQKSFPAGGYRAPPPPLVGGDAGPSALDPQQNVAQMGNARGSASSVSSASLQAQSMRSPKRVTIEDDEDAQVRRALELSKAEAEDRAVKNAMGTAGDSGDADVSRAIEESLKNPGDPELKRALAISLQDIPSSDGVKAAEAAWFAAPTDEDPRQRRRRPLADPTGKSGGSLVSSGSADTVAAVEASVVSSPRGARTARLAPVGLKNIGNTCYLNSLLQVYGHLPEFRRLIFRYRATPRLLETILERRNKPRVAENSLGGNTTVESNFTRNNISSNSLSGGAATAVGATGATTHGVGARPNTPEPAGDGADETQEKLSNLDVSSVEFVIELQKLFAKMALGNQSHADPFKLVLAMRDEGGGQISIGRQEDAFEFNGMFLGLIERAFNVCPQNGLTTNPIKKMFEASFTQTVASTNLGSKSETSKPTRGATVALIVDASSSTRRDLYSGLDDLTITTVDDHKGQQTSQQDSGVSQPGDAKSMPSEKDVPKLDSSESIVKTKVMRFSKFAPVLTIYLQRVRYNRGACRAEKINSKYAFATELAVDRYLEQHADASDSARKTVESVRAERAKLTESMALLRTFGAAPAATTGTPLSGQGSLADQASMGSESSPKRAREGTDARDAPGVFSGAGGLTAPMSGAGKGSVPGPFRGGDDISVALRRVSQRVSSAVSSPIVPQAESALSSSAASMLRVPGVSQADAKTVLDILERVSAHDGELTRKQQTEMAELLEMEHSAYRGLDRQRYRLHAVLVHDGDPLSGHYWTFVRNSHSEGEHDRWLKLNDMLVTPHSENEVLVKSGGGSGFASAYCLIYTSVDWKTQALSGHADPMDVDSGAIQELAEEARMLLSPELLDEIEASNLAYEEEVEAYTKKAKIRDFVNFGRGVLDAAVVSLRKATNELDGLASTNSLLDGVDVVPGRTCRVRSLLEFVHSTKAIRIAALCALGSAWSRSSANLSGQDRDLLALLSRNEYALSAFPPLARSKIEHNVTDSSAVKIMLDEIQRCLSNFHIEFPADVRILDRDSSQYLADALVGGPKLQELVHAANVMRSFYSFSLRATSMLRTALSCALEGHWVDALGVCVELVRQRPEIFYEGMRNPGEEVRTHAANFLVDPSMTYGRREEEALLFLPCILEAARGCAIKIQGEKGDFRALGLAKPLVAVVADLSKVLAERLRKKRVTAMALGRPQASHTEELVMHFTDTLLRDLAFAGSPGSVGNMPEARKHLQKRITSALKEASQDATDIPARLYEPIRDELCGLGGNVRSHVGIAQAGRKLLKRAETKTAEA